MPPGTDTADVAVTAPGPDGALAVARNAPTLTAPWKAGLVAELNARTRTAGASSVASASADPLLAASWSIAVVVCHGEEIVHNAPPSPRTRPANCAVAAVVVPAQVCCQGHPSLSAAAIETLQAVIEPSDAALLAACSVPETGCMLTAPSLVGTAEFAYMMSAGLACAPAAVAASLSASASWLDAPVTTTDVYAPVAEPRARRKVASVVLDRAAGRYSVASVAPLA